MGLWPGGRKPPCREKQPPLKIGIAKFSTAWEGTIKGGSAFVKLHCLYTLALLCWHNRAGRQEKQKKGRAWAAPGIPSLFVCQGAANGQRKCRPPMRAAHFCGNDLPAPHPACPKRVRKALLQPPLGGGAKRRGGSTLKGSGQGRQVRQDQAGAHRALGQQAGGGLAAHD